MPGPSSTRSHRPRPSGSAWTTPSQPTLRDGQTPSSEPNPHTTRDSGHQRQRRWPGNYEKLASSGCPSVRMNTDLDKSYSPCSEGYSPVTTRYRGQLHRWIAAQQFEAIAVRPVRSPAPKSVTPG